MSTKVSRSQLPAPRLFAGLMLFLLILQQGLAFGQNQSPLTKTKSLNGPWRFAGNNDWSAAQALKESKADWAEIAVPGNWEQLEEYESFRGRGFYFREFSVEQDWQHTLVRLQFEAVYEKAEVYLNGYLLGSHTGGYLPFEFEVSALLNYGAANEVMVVADNRYHRGAWWPWGGISREVSLLSSSPARIKQQHISAIPDLTTGEVKVELDFWLENNFEEQKEFTLQPSIKDSHKKNLWNTELKVQVAPGEIRQFSHQFTLPLAVYQLWDQDSPVLYRLQTVLAEQAGASLDLKEDKFGIRKVEVIGTQIMLNGKPVYANGFNRVHDHPSYGNTEPDALVEKDMVDIMALGGKMSRLMHAPLSRNILDLCDSLGYLLIEEVPIWGDDEPLAYPNSPLPKQWMEEMIARDYNHPSVIGWSVGNELRDPQGDWQSKTLTTQQYGYIQHMLELVEQLDPHRLKTYVTLTSYLPKADQSNEPYEMVDFISINSYGNAVNAAKETHRKFPDKPIFVSEIGIAQIGPAPAGALSEKLILQLRELADLDFVVGSSLWSYNDYRSDYKGTPDSGFREWGVVDENRQPKAAYSQIKKLWNP